MFTRRENRLQLGHLAAARLELRGTDPQPSLPRLLGGHACTLLLKLTFDPLGDLLLDAAARLPEQPLLLAYGLLALNQRILLRQLLLELRARRRNQRCRQRLGQTDFGAAVRTLYGRLSPIACMLIGVNRFPRRLAVPNAGRRTQSRASR